MYLDIVYFYVYSKNYVYIHKSQNVLYFKVEEV